MSVEALSLVLNHSRAVGTDKVVLLGIANHDGDGGSWPSIATLARYANVSERTVKRSLRTLEATGELHTEQNAGGTDRTENDRRPNRYTILLRGDTHVTPAANGVTPASPGGMKGTTPRGVTPTSPEPSLEPSSEPSLFRTERTVSDSRALGAVVSFDAALDGWDFDRFWTEYPLNKGKQRALQEWERQVVKAAVDPRVVIAAAVRYRDECERDGTFFAHASSWLHQHRWEDEPAPARVQPPTSSFGRKMAALRAFGAHDDPVSSHNGRVLASSRAHSLPRGATDGNERRDSGTP